jgi:hypothetical protein
MAAVLAGDLLVLLAFVAIGQYTHGYLFWEVPIYATKVAVPFVVAWLAVFPAIGLYAEKRLGSYRRTALLVVGAWLGVAFLGGAIRATALFPGGSPPSFLAANIVFGLLFFMPWRLFVSRQLGR